MVQSIINISEHANRVLTIVKAKYGLKDKSQAINMMAQEYEEEILEPQLRPEFIEKLKTASKEKRIKVNNFKEHFGLSEE